MCSQIFTTKPGEITNFGTNLNSKSINLKTLYPEYFDINQNTKSLLIALLEMVKPKVILETGVANGISTNIFLKHAPYADIHSIDINANVMSDELSRYDNWTLHILKKRKDFIEILNSLDRLSFFFHDSDHSYPNQLFEYTYAWQKLEDCGVLVSDDINWSYAFLNFCKRLNQKPFVLADGAKFVGVIVKKQT